MITKKTFQHDVIVNGTFYRAGEEVKIDDGIKEETPKKVTSTKKETTSTK